MKKKAMKKAMKKAVNKLRKLYLKGGGTNFSSFLYKEAGLHMGTDENPYIFDPKKPRTAFTPPSSLERARTSCLENSRPSEPVINFWDEFKPVFDADGQRIDYAAIQNSLHTLFDVENVRLGDTPLPEGSVILTGDSK